MAEATLPDVKRFVGDDEDLFNGDLSKLNVPFESFRYYGPGLPKG